MSKNELKNSILYYPTINIPNGVWLRNAILYWDEVTSIVPDNFSRDELSSDLLFLQSEGFFRPLSPRNFLSSLRNYSTIQEFTEEFFEIIKSVKFKRLLQIEYGARIIVGSSDSSGLYRIESEMLSFSTRIHNEKLHRVHRDKLTGRRIIANEFRVNQDKLSYIIVDVLQRIGLISHDRRGDWWYMEKNTALVYMSLLAKYMAGVDRERTIPGTNNSLYQNLVFPKASGKTAYPVYDLQLSRVLPIPRSGVPIETILDFKRNKKRAKELVRFQKSLAKFQRTLSAISNQSDLKDHVADFRTELKAGVNGLKEVLDESRIDTVLGGVKNLVGIKPLAKGGLVSIGLDKIAEKFSLGTGLSIAGITGVAAIELTHYYVQRRNQKNAALRNSAFSYLYHLDRSMMIRGLDE